MNEIADCIEHNIAAVREDIVKMVAGIAVEVELEGYSAAEMQLNTRDEILSAMVVFVFLFYHDGYLRIPNRELMEKYQKILARDREIPFLQYNDENALSCVVTLCYLYARKDYYVEREAKSGKGYCDYLFLPQKSGRPAIILELKVDDTCAAALDQIKERNYIAKAREYAREILLVGISYDKTKKRHDCVIESVEGCDRNQ